MSAERLAHYLGKIQVAREQMDQCRAIVDREEATIQTLEERYGLMVRNGANTTEIEAQIEAAVAKRAWHYWWAESYSNKIRKYERRVACM
ncbi:hypothetical protein AA313_de0206017 [Arthrobotrys entomopaga]|nr:hypothetical protein AA313_de0206017 [Arthrobotrys entomopaga]